MREIKFRAWDGDAELMIYSDNCPDDYFFEFTDGQLKAYGIYLHPGSYDEPEHYDSYEIAPIMQYTGIKDGNDNEIYEGDVFQFGSNKEWARGNCDRGEVIWHEKLARFGLDFYSIYGGEGYTGKTQHLIDFIQGEKATGNYREIIGNIYENPELLEDK